MVTAEQRGVIWERLGHLRRDIEDEYERRALRKFLLHLAQHAMGDVDGAYQGRSGPDAAGSPPSGVYRVYAYWQAGADKRLQQQVEARRAVAVLRGGAFSSWSDLQAGFADWYDAYAALPNPQWRWVLELTIFNGARFEDVGEELGISDRWARELERRGLRAMLTYMRLARRRENEETPTRLDASSAFHATASALGFGGVAAG